MGTRKSGRTNDSSQRPSGRAAPIADYAREGLELDLPLLRALALGGKRSAEMQLLIESRLEPGAGVSAVMNNSQMLALLLADLSVTEQKAAVTFRRLLGHQKRMRDALGRSVGIKTAALDYLENIERALKIKDDENALTYTQLSQLAFSDQLTGLANFRSFALRLKDEVRRCERYGHLLSLLMTDLDFFKTFNDRHGHPAGNKALQVVARCLAAEVRETDVLARYGGEEFALILPHTTKTEAAALAERIRKRVEDQRMQVEGRQPVKLTLSVGVATLPRDAHTEEGLVSAADQALYQAKQSGRNRVWLYQPPTRTRFIYVPDARDAVTSVSVIGDFNDWKADADPMLSNGAGAFELELPLAAGQYQYKLVVNGKEYVPDPRCKEQEPDGYGGMNSVVVVQ